MPKYYTHETDPVLATVRERDQLKLRIEALQRERDEAQEVTRKTVASLIAVTASVDRLEKERDEARKAAARNAEGWENEWAQWKEERDEARRLLVEFAWALEPCGDGGQTRRDWKNRLYELDWFLPLSEEMEAKEEPGNP